MASPVITLCNPEAERSVLGAVLLDNFCYHEAAASLQADDFGLDSHRVIFSRMEELINSGRAIDYVTLADILGKQGRLEGIGGVAYLTSLTDGLPRTKNIEHYVVIVRDCSRARMITHMAENAITRLQGSDKPDDVLEDVQQRIIEVVYHGKQGSGMDMMTAGRDALRHWEEIRKMDGRCIGAPTGLEPLDELTTGFREKEFYVIGGRPGNGKTAFMCQGVRAQVKEGWRPGIFSIEVPREQIIARLACQETGIAVTDTRDPRLMKAEDYCFLREAAAEVAHWECFIEDTPRLSLKQIAAIARMWIAKGCNCIWVDYLHKIKVPGAGNRFEKVTAIADGLWELARFAGVPVVALSQLSRPPHGVVPPAPTLQDLRESGEIEQNANAVFLLHRPQEPDNDGTLCFSGEDQLIVAKQRSGIAGVHVPVHFNGPVGMYEPDLDRRERG